MACVMPDHEQSRDPQRGHQRGEHLHPPHPRPPAGSRWRHPTPANREEPNDGCGTGTIQGERLQQLLKCEPAIYRQAPPAPRQVLFQVGPVSGPATRALRRGSGSGVGVCIRNSGRHAQGRTKHYTLPHPGKTGTMSGGFRIGPQQDPQMLAGHRSGPWRLPACWRPTARSWVNSQVRRARRDRADGSLSNSAGNNPSASTNSRIGAVAVAWAPVSGAASATSRSASPACPGDPEAGAAA